MKININEIIKRKEKFVEKLSESLEFSNSTFKSLEYKVSFDDDKTIISEEVIVTCDNDYKYSVNITGDSEIAIMMDVAKFLIAHS